MKPSPDSPSSFAPRKRWLWNCPAFPALASGCLSVILLGGPAALPAADFSDSFEGPSLHPFWSLLQNSGSITLSSNLAHTGEQSVRLHSTYNTGQKNIELFHVMSQPVYGRVSVRLFDTGADEQSANYLGIYVSNRELGVSASLFTQDYDEGSANGGTYAFTPFQAPGAATSVDRTKAWHHLVITATAEALTMEIDGITIYTGAGGTRFDRVALEMHGPSWRPAWNCAFDDFEFTEFVDSHPPGFVYWSTAGELPGGPVNSQIKRARFGSSNVTTLVTAPASFRFGGMAFDPANGHLYSGDGSTLFRTTLDGHHRTVIISNTTVADIELSLGNGKLYWTDTTRDLIHSANLDGSGIQTIRRLNFLDLVEGLAVDSANGKIYYTYGTSPAASRIRMMNLDGASHGDFLSLAATAFAFDVEIDPNRRCIYWNQAGPPRQGIWRANLDGARLPELIYEPSDRINNGLHYDPAGDHFYYATTSDNGATTDLRRVNVDGTSPELIIHEPGRMNYVESLRGLAIRSQPSSQTISPGSTVTFNIQASGVGQLTYQWRHNGVDIPGATESTLILAHANPSQAGTYSVLISDRLGSVVSASAVLAFLDLRMYAGLILTAPVGTRYTIEYSDAVSSPGAWQTLTTIVLSESPYRYIDNESPNHPKRFYRATPTP
jgi:hypothetical protein